MSQPIFQVPKINSMHSTSLIPWALYTLHLSTCFLSCRSFRLFTASDGRCQKKKGSIHNVTLSSLQHTSAKSHLMLLTFHFMTIDELRRYSIWQAFHNYRPFYLKVVEHSPWLQTKSLSVLAIAQPDSEAFMTYTLRTRVSRPEQEDELSKVKHDLIRLAAPPFHYQNPDRLSCKSIGTKSSTQGTSKHQISLVCSASNCEWILRYTWWLENQSSFEQEINGWYYPSSNKHLASTSQTHLMVTPSWHNIVSSTLSVSFCIGVEEKTGWW